MSLLNSTQRNDDNITHKSMDSFSIVLSSNSPCLLGSQLNCKSIHRNPLETPPIEDDQIVKHIADH
jgi:hypothetical protein